MDEDDGSPMREFFGMALAFGSILLAVVAALAGIVLLHAKVGEEMAAGVGVGLLAALAWQALRRWQAAIGVLVLVAWATLPAGTTRAVVSRLVPDLPTPSAPAPDEGEAVVQADDARKGEP